MTCQTSRNPESTVSGDWLGWAKAPGFHPGKLVAVLVGFAIFPPLGVVALIYFLWSSRRYGWGGHTFAGGPRGRFGRRRWSTGNQAFDEYSAKVINELRVEREAFAAHLAGERLKRDNADLEAFRAARETQADKPAGNEQ